MINAMSRFASPFKLVQSMPLAIRIASLLAFLLAGSLLLTTQLFEREMNNYRAEQQTQLSQLLGKQSAQIAAVQILDNDGISLTVTADQLSQHPFISGVEILDNQKQLLAKAGKPNDRRQLIPIRSNDSPLGELRLYLDEAPQIKELSIAFYRTTLAAIVTCALSWLVLFVYVRRTSPALSALRNAAEQLQNKDRITPLIVQRSDELGQIATLLNLRFSPAQTSDTSTSVQEAPHSPPVEPDHPPSEKIEAPLYTDHEIGVLTVQCSPNSAASITEINTTVEPDANRVSASSVQTTRRYLFYIDHLSTASENLTPSERQQLLAGYTSFLQQVVNLYKGRLVTDDTGNWCGEFEPLDGGESHGINALCAAQLFNALYRGINQRAIREMQPVANIKMALLAGSESFSALMEEAESLCRRIEANALIVGEELFEVGPLVDRLLSEADSRALEQPARLLNRLNEDYQTLIEQQAQHFLTRQG